MQQTLSLVQLLPSAANCEECRTLLQNALQALPGVQRANINALQVELQTQHKLDSEVAQAVQQVRQQHTHQTLNVQGMDCPNCAKTVEGAVCRLPGVSQYQLNYVAQRLEVAYNPQQLALSDLSGAIEPLGYKVQPVNPPQTHTPVIAPLSRWYQARQVQPVLYSGAWLLLAWVLGHLQPTLSGGAYTLAVLLGGWPFALKAWRAAKVGNPFSIYTLMSVAAAGAIAIGEAAEAAVVVFLFALGEWLEAQAAYRARKGIRALAALAPKTAWLWQEGRVQQVEASALLIGQEVLVPPGERVPADGVVLSGQSALDQSAVTGESLPVAKGPGQTVLAGSINTEAALVLTVQRPAHDNTIARVLRLVEEAQANKAPIQRFMDRFSRVYTPLVMLLALLTMLLPPLLAGQPWSDWMYRGLALLLIGCPCALLISVPAAVTSGLAAAARRGLLIKGGAALEAIGQSQAIAFDKTGTLTLGQPQVSQWLAVGVSDHELLAKAAAVEQGSTHPLAKAIVAQAQSLGLTLPAVSQQRSLAGQAALANLEGQTLAVASPAYAAKALSSQLQPTIAAWQAQGQSVVVVLQQEQVLGLIALRDAPHPESRAAVAQLRAWGLRPLMLSGDNRHTVAAMAAELNLEAQAELLPQDKWQAIKELQKQQRVAFVGDGINDAAALAQANVGIAMGKGTQVALEAADAALLRNSVWGVCELVQISRATLSNIRLNVALALGLKAFFLAATLSGNAQLWMAVLADTGATVLVTANALRLLAFRPVTPHT